MKKSFRQIERIVRGVSNHRRVQILVTLEARPDIDLQTLAAACRANMKTVGEHARRLATAGLVLKKSKGASVIHTLSPRGIRVLAFVKELE
jgi:hypothetical protein